MMYVFSSMSVDHGYCFGVMLGCILCFLIAVFIVQHHQSYNPLEIKL